MKFAIGQTYKCDVTHGDEKYSIKFKITDIQDDDYYIVIDIEDDCDDYFFINNQKTEEFILKTLRWKEERYCKVLQNLTLIQ